MPIPDYKGAPLLYCAAGGPPYYKEPDGRIRDVPSGRVLSREPLSAVQSLQSSGLVRIDFSPIRGDFAPDKGNLEIE
jgi:hypothetical protein